MLHYTLIPFAERQKITMNLVRVGDKVINKDKIYRTIDRLLAMRTEGLSQAESASLIGTDRSFVSRLESLGEVRKGSKIALIGFPIKNKEEIDDVCKKYGLDKIWIMTNDERWVYIRSRSGEELLNDIQELVSELQELDYVIFLGSDMRVNLMEAVLKNKVIGIEIGKSPIKSDVFIQVEKIISIIEKIRS